MEQRAMKKKRREIRYCHVAAHYGIAGKFVVWASFIHSVRVK